MKILLIAAALLVSQVTFAAVATSADALARNKVVTYMLRMGLAGSFPGVQAPAGKELCQLSHDALAGIGMFHGKTDSEISQVLNFPGITAAQIPQVVQILSQAEVDCSNAPAN
jgi:hypothetical protein